MSEAWQESDGRNVFQMIMDHGGPGAWVRRTTWGSKCARIVAMGESTKPPPYFGNPPVLMDVYTLSGKLTEELAELETAGTFKTWRQISPPAWASAANLRPLEDPAISDALERIEEKKRKKGTKSVDTRIRLDVPFARKAEAKALGARWDPGSKTWWLPAKESEEAQARASQLGFLRRK